MRLLATGLSLLMGVGAALSGAEATYAGGAVGGRWLNVEGSARISALGGAGVAEGGEFRAAGLNPAAPLGMAGSAMGFTHVQEAEDSSRDLLSWAMGSGPGQAFLMDLDFTSFGTVEHYRLDAASGRPESAGSSHPYGLRGRGGWASSLGPLQFGLGLGLLFQDLGGQSASAVSGDLGLQGPLAASMAWGASLANFGNDLAGGRQPLKARAGIAWAPGSAPAALFLDANWSDGGSAGGALGLEYLVQENFALRAGYRLGDALARRGFSAGLGFSYGLLGVDYAYEATSELGASQLLSLNLRFGDAAAARRPKRGGWESREARRRRLVDEMVAAVLGKDYVRADALEAELKVEELEAGSLRQAGEKIRSDAVEPMVFDGRFYDAQRALELLTRLEPQNAYNHMALGYMLVCQRKDAQARPELERALDLDPSKIFIKRTLKHLK